MAVIVYLTLKFYSSATLRENLDPLMTHDDVQLLDALKKARLLDVVRQKLAPIDPIQGGRGLDAMIDYETTFSSGRYLSFSVHIIRSIPLTLPHITKIDHNILV